jgi:hypothetical protein
VVVSEVSETLRESALRDPVEHLDLLPDEEVNPGWVVSYDELLVT